MVRYLIIFALEVGNPSKLKCEKQNIIVQFCISFCHSVFFFLTASDLFQTLLFTALLFSV